MISLLSIHKNTYHGYCGGPKTSNTLTVWKVFGGEKKKKEYEKRWCEQSPSPVQVPLTLLYPVRHVQ